MRFEKSLMAVTTIATALLVAIPLAASKRLPSAKPVPEATLPGEGPHPEAANAPSEAQTVPEEDDSAPGGPAVVLGLFALFGVVGLFVAAFVFPPAFVAAGVTFGSVSLLGLVVLYVHFRAHTSGAAAPKESVGSRNPVGANQVEVDASRNSVLIL